ncbi:MAG: PQQ-binding-like beta-propeller repeat protein [Opitutales bacterium]
MYPSFARDSWTSFRNEGTDKSAATNLPLKWAPKESISWQRELPGYGQSSPLLQDGVLYLTYVEGPKKEKSSIMACDPRTGNTLWKTAISTSSPDASYYAKSRSAPTPAIDDNGLYVFFEGGDLAALSHDGETKWQRSLTREYGDFKNGHGLGTSLAQKNDALVLLIDHSGPSYLLSIDKATGKNLWKTDRESRVSWTTPIIANIQGREQVVVSSNGSVDGYDLSNGKMLWTYEGISGNTIPSPSVVGNRIFVGGQGKSAALCIDFPDANQLGEYKILWQTANAGVHYASPLSHGNNIYMVDKLGAIHCVDKDTGETRFTKKSADICWTTPVAVDKYLYFFAKNGTTTVLKAGDTFNEVSANALWDTNSPPQPERYVQHPPEDSASSPSFADNLKAADKDKDGLIVKSELPEPMQRSFGRIDANGDGTIDAKEIQAIADRSSNRSGSNSFGDPVVYGLAVGDGAFFVRTGTRLYCIRSDNVGS